MSRSTKVLILDNTVTFGGAIRSLQNLIPSIDLQRFSPVIVSGQPEAYLADNFDCRWIHYVPKLPWVDNRHYQRFARRGLFKIRLLRRLLNLSRFLWWMLLIHFPDALLFYRIGKKNRANLLHLNNIFGGQISGILAAKLLQVPCVAHMRDFEEIHPITRFYARLIDHHIAVSRAVAECLQALGVPEERITIVHDSVDLSQFAAGRSDTVSNEDRIRPPGELSYGIFGRLVPWKGIREFILAARQVADVVPNSRAYIVGEPSPGEEDFVASMKALARALELENHIRFVGFIQEIPEWMRRMDVVVHASNTPEPFGMVLIEAMAAGRPVVATSAGGALDIVVHGDTGFLVEMGSADALSSAVVKLLNNPDLRRRMGNAGRQRAERLFSNKQAGVKMDAIYSRLVQPGFL